MSAISAISAISALTPQVCNRPDPIGPEELAGIRSFLAGWRQPPATPPGQ